MNEPAAELTPAELHRLAELAERLRHDALADDEVAELESLLAESASAREAFAAFAVLAADLRHAQGRFACPVPAGARARSALSFLRARWLPIAAAAGIALAAFFGWSRTPWSSAAPGPVIATVSNVSSAVLFRGKESASSAVGTALHAGSLQLRAGIMELTYPSGVVIVLVAPARFDLRNGTTLWLAEGKASARVPTAAAGFIVETPSARIVDLGTEFGISAGAASSEVHVFKGAVLVANSDEPDSLRLTANHASRIDTRTRTPTGIDCRPERFFRTLEEPQARYPELIHEFAPVAYYRMRITSDASRLLDVSPQHLDGRIFPGLSQQTTQPGRIGAGLRLGGPAAQSFALVPNFPQANDAALTVCAWVRADSRPRWASIAKNWAKGAGKNKGGQFHFGLWHDEGNLEVHVHDAAGREVGVRDPDALPIGEWQFVAFTLDGTMLRLYRNGHEVAATPCAGLTSSAPSALALGAKLDASGTRPERNTPGYWDGIIDELAVFHRPLSATEIRSLYEAVR